ncbi:transcriptional regulator, partial [Streptomyces sp. WAC 06725]
MAAPRGPNSRLRDTISATGCTYEALARDVRRIAAENGEILQTNKSAVSHWTNGTRQPTGRTGQYLAEALSRRTGRIITQTEIGLRTPDGQELAEGDPVLAATDLGRADVERRRFLAVAAFTTAGVAMPLAHDHEVTTRMLRAHETC